MLWFLHGVGRVEHKYGQLHSAGHTAIVWAGFPSHAARNSCLGLRPAQWPAAARRDRQAALAGPEALCPVGWAYRAPGAWEAPSLGH